MLTFLLSVCRPICNMPVEGMKGFFFVIIFSVSVVIVFTSFGIVKNSPRLQNIISMVDDPLRIKRNIAVTRNSTARIGSLRKTAPSKNSTLKFGSDRKSEFGKDRKSEFGKSRKLELGQKRKLELQKNRKPQFDKISVSEFNKDRKAHFGKNRKLESGKNRKVRFDHSRGLSRTSNHSETAITISSNKNKHNLSREKQFHTELNYPLLKTDLSLEGKDKRKGNQHNNLTKKHLNHSAVLLEKLNVTLNKIQNSTKRNNIHDSTKRRDNENTNTASKKSHQFPATSKNPNRKLPVGTRQNSSLTKSENISKNYTSTKEKEASRVSKHEDNSRKETGVILKNKNNSSVPREEQLSEKRQLGHKAQEKTPEDNSAKATVLHSKDSDKNNDKTTRVSRTKSSAVKLYPYSNVTKKTLSAKEKTNNNEKLFLDRVHGYNTKENTQNSNSFANNIDDWII